MSRISTQSIFQSTTTKRTWQTYAYSAIVHAAIILLLFTITVPVLREVHRPVPNFTLIAPSLPEFRPRPVHHIEPVRLTPKQIDAVRTPARVFRPPVPVLKSVQQAPQILAAAPEIKVTHPIRTMPEAKPDLPAAPKPLIKTGVFAQPTEIARATPAPTKLAVGGFGDPNGVKPSSQTSPSSVMLAKTGSFDQPNGEGHSGGGGHSQVGEVRQAAFGSLGEPGGSPHGTGNGAANGAVHTGGFSETGGVAGGTGHGPGAAVRTTSFGDSTPVASPVQPRAVQAAPSTTPVEILFKPRPAYTEEARTLHLEGQVSLEVVFLSNGSIRVVRIVRGLGHGLDEAAQKAALQVRFKPAMRGGIPVDTNATINITFELT